MAMSNSINILNSIKNDPFMDAAMRGWLINYTRNNFWRVPEWIEEDDLLNDGIMCFYKCRERYTFLTVKRHPLTDDKKRFMALVQAAFTNHITTLSNRRTAVHERPLSQHIGPEENVAEAWTRMLPSQPEESSTRLLLANAPQEIKSLLQALVSDSSAAAEFVRSRLIRREGETGVRVQRLRRQLRETTNEYFCRLVGLNPRETDLVGRVQQYFGA